MANTTVVGNSTITITGLDADWIAGTDTTPQTFKVSSIQFIPSAQNDRMIIRDNEIGGATLFDSGKSAGTTAIIEYFWPWKVMRPVIDISDCTLDTAASAKVIIGFVR